MEKATQHSMKLTPLKDNILVRQLDPVAISEGGIFIPDRARRQSKRATVLAVGETACPDVKPGDMLYIMDEGGTLFDIEGKPHLLLTENEILAVFDK